MAHYINKGALVAEIKRLIECCYKMCAGDLDFLQKSYPEHYYSIETYKEILSFINTLEVSSSNPITAADRGIQLPIVTVKEAIERKIINSPFALKGAYSGKMYFYSWKKSISKMPENIANLKLSMNYDFNKGKELGSYNIEPMVRFIESSFSNKPFLEPYILVWVSDYELSKKGE